jgi:hypothetical protein
MISGGKRNPLKVERGTGAGGGRRILRSAVSLLKAVVANATAPVNFSEIAATKNVATATNAEDPTTG